MRQNHYKCRSDSLSFVPTARYGNPVTKTPYLDGLAKEGTLFTQAHVLHTQCAPSRHAIVTGRYMHTTGHRTQSHGVEEWEPDIFKYLHDAVRPPIQPYRTRGADNPARRKVH